MTEKAPSITVLLSTYSTGGLEILILLLTTSKGLLFLSTSSLREIPSRYYLRRDFNRTLSFLRLLFVFLWLVCLIELCCIFCRNCWGRSILLLPRALVGRNRSLDLRGSLRGLWYFRRRVLPFLFLFLVFCIVLQFLGFFLLFTRILLILIRRFCCCLLALLVRMINLLWWPSFLP